MDIVQFSLLALLQRSFKSRIVAFNVFFFYCSAIKENRNNKYVLISATIKFNTLNTSPLFY